MLVSLILVLDQVFCSNLRNCVADWYFFFGHRADHRICVWNAVDGSLVHSLTGHDKQVLILFKLSSVPEVCHMKSFRF